MPYSFPQSVLEKVRTWPEYYKLIEILHEKFVDLGHIHELLIELYWRGNVFLPGNATGIS
jgi:hypothetical protein